MVTPIFEGVLAHYRTPEADRSVNAYLKTQAFEPACAWEHTFDITSDILIPWSARESSWMNLAAERSKGEE